MSQSKHTRPDALTDESAGEQQDGWLEEEIDEDNITHEEEDDDDVTVDSCAPEGRPCSVVYDSWLCLVQLINCKMIGTFLKLVLLNRNWFTSSHVQFSSTD